MAERGTDVAKRMRRLSLCPGSPAALGFAVVCVVVATAVRMMFGALSSDLVAFGLYYPAVVNATLVAGTTAGAIALVLGRIMSWWTFTQPYFTVVPPTRGQAADRGLYVSASALPVWAAGNSRQLVERLEKHEAALEQELVEKALREDVLRQANERNEVLIRELHHHVKNNL